MRCAPSSTTISTVSVSVAEPTWSMTTTDSLCRSAWMSRCVAVGSSDRPSMRTEVTSLATASAGIVTTVASANAFQAVTAVRSPGTPARPSRSSSRPTIMTSTSGASTTVVRTPALPSSVENSGARRLTGEKRHSSSRPVGSVMTAGSNEVMRSAREPCGVPPTPCE